MPDPRSYRLARAAAERAAIINDYHRMMAAREAAMRVVTGGDPQRDRDEAAAIQRLLLDRTRAAAQQSSDSDMARWNDYANRQVGPVIEFDPTVVDASRNVPGEPLEMRPHTFYTFPARAERLHLEYLMRQAASPDVGPPPPRIAPVPPPGPGGPWPQRIEPLPYKGEWDG